MRWTPGFLFWLFFSPKGRINRAQWWLAVILLLILSLPSVLIAFDEDFMERYFVQIALFDLAALYPCFAVDSKRFQDRDRSGFWALFAVMAAMLLSGSQLLSFSGIQQPLELEWMFAGMLLAISAWYFIELGCARGAAGPNNFGSDPLQHPGGTPRIALSGD